MGNGLKGPTGANIGVAFTGLVSVPDAIAGYASGASWCCPPLNGKRFISLGGGNAAGTFTAPALASIRNDLDDVIKANYTGICFDVEQVSGSASVMVPEFAKTFAAVKERG